MRPLGKKKTRGDFFQVERVTWNRACDAGFHAATALLVLTRGTGGDNRTTAWSAKAVESYTGLSWRQAKNAIVVLEEAGIVRQTQAGKYPRYYIQPAGETPAWIWLPNAIVDGVAGEKSPLRLILETSCDSALRLFVELYHQQDLKGHGGLPPDQIWKPFDRQKIGEHGAYVIWGFTAATPTVLRGAPFVHKPAGRKSDLVFEEFWHAINLLRLTGLLYVVGHVMTDDAPRGQLVHPYGLNGVGEETEVELAEAAHDAAMALLPKCLEYRAEQSEHLLPAKAHLENVQIVGVFRLRYKPKTLGTTLWLTNAEQWQEHLAYYRKIASDMAKLNNQANSKA